MSAAYTHSRQASGDSCVSRLSDAGSVGPESPRLTVAVDDEDFERDPDMWVSIHRFGTPRGGRSRKPSTQRRVLRDRRERDSFVYIGDDAFP